MEVTTTKGASVQRVQLRDISTRDIYQVRQRLNEEAIERYREIMEEAGRYDFPPVVLLEEEGLEKYEIISGYHRIEAARRAGLEEVTAYVEQPAPKFSQTEKTIGLILKALKSNSRHGVPLTHDDAKKAVQMIIRENPELSIREIERLTDGVLTRSRIGYIMQELKGKPRQYRPAESAKEQIREILAPADLIETERPGEALKNGELVLCGNCGAPSFPEWRNNPESGWVMNPAGRWYCSEECRQEGESKELEAMGTVIITAAESENSSEGSESSSGRREELAAFTRPIEEPREEFRANVEPCRVCGQRPAVESTYDQHRTAKMYWVECTTCKVKHRLTVKTLKWQHRKDAVAQWNEAMGGAK